MRGIVFDWDGTLADSHSSLYEANAAVMRAFDLPFSPELYRDHYAPDWRVMYERLGVPAHRLDEANRVWEAAFHGTRTTSLLPGAREALEQLRAAGIGVGLVTAGPRPIVQPQIERLELDGLISVRVFGDDQPEQKPDPTPLRRALRGLGLDATPADTAYLGDAPDDMRMAVRTGVRPIGVVSVLSDRHLLLDAGAAAVTDSVAAWVRDLLASPAPTAA